jgi:hypothetical protein
MLAAGDRVCVRWSGKTGRVLRPIVRRPKGREGAPGVLVRLDPFTACWHGTTPVTIFNLEIIYAPEDLARIAEPPRSRRP